MLLQQDGERCVNSFAGQAPRQIVLLLWILTIRMNTRVYLHLHQVLYLGRDE